MQPYKEQESMLFNFELTLLKGKVSKNIKWQQASQHITNILLHRQNNFLGKSIMGHRENHYCLKLSLGSADLLVFSFWKLAYN